MKPILVLLCCCCCLTCYCQDTLTWHPDYKLSWSDFKGSPDMSSGFLASSSSGISYSYAYTNNEVTFVAEAFFVRPASWRKTKADTSLLKHEQGHFDITEIFARKITSTIRPKMANKPLPEKEVTAIADSLVAAKNEYQKEYDLQTKNGTDKIIQQQWLDKIAAQLKRQQ